MTTIPPPFLSRRRIGWRGAALAVLGAAVLWSAGWWLAARLAASGFDAWLQAEAALGRQWTCPARRVEGYPFALDIRCDRPTFRGEIAGHVAAGVVEGLAARVALDHWGWVDVVLASPLNLRAEDGTFELDVSWASMALGLRGVTSPPEGGSFQAARLAVTLSTRGNDDVNLRGAAVSGTAGPGPDRAGDAAFTFAATGVSLPTMDAIPGLDGPAEAAGEGVLTRADLLQAPTVARLEAWRKAGGRLELGGLSLRKGPFAGSASGALGLDPLHRAAGRLDSSLAGFGPIAARFGIPIAGVQLGGLLSTLLGGGKAPAAAPGTVQVPLILADGLLAIGPFTTGVRLTPLY